MHPLEKAFRSAVHATLCALDNRFGLGMIAEVDEKRRLELQRLVDIFHQNPSPENEKAVRRAGKIWRPNSGFMATVPARDYAPEPIAAPKSRL